MLKCLEQELGEKQRETKERKLAKKYRMVKFFGALYTLPLTDYCSKILHIMFVNFYSIYCINFMSVMTHLADKRKVSRKLKAKLKELSECEDDKK